MFSELVFVWSLGGKIWKWYEFLGKLFWICEFFWMGCQQNFLCLFMTWNQFWQKSVRKVLELHKLKSECARKWSNMCWRCIRKWTNMRGRYINKLANLGDAIDSSNLKLSMTDPLTGVGASKKWTNTWTNMNGRYINNAVVWESPAACLDWTTWTGWHRPFPHLQDWATTGFNRLSTGFKRLTTVFKRLSSVLKRLTTGFKRQSCILRVCSASIVTQLDFIPCFGVSLC